MRTNPLSDAVLFLTGGTEGHASIGWCSVPFVTLSSVLVIGSLTVAVVNWSADPAQRNGRNLALWLMRALTGGMWLEGSLWKLPLPVSGGFSYWLGLLGDNAAFGIYGDLVKSVLIPSIAFINPLIFLVEFSLATALMLGIAVRLTALLGVAMALNLWIGLYHYQPEWPWTYVFIILLHVFFVVDRAGRALGLDGTLLRRASGWVDRHAWVKLVV